MESKPTPDPSRALPGRTPENARLWDSCQAHALELQRCDDCGRMRYYPAPICPYCSATGSVWAPVSGRGTVHSFTWVHRAAPGFAALAPYAYGLVELEEGPVMATNLVGIGEDELVIGMPVKVRYEDVAPDVTLPLWEPLR